VVTVDTLGSGGEHTFLSVGPGGYLHASYRWSGWIRYAYQDDSGWHSEDVLADYRALGFALGGNGTPHMFYSQEEFAELRHTHRVGGVWEIEVVSQGTVWPTDVACVIDGSGYPHVSFTDVCSNDMLYGHKDGSGWQFELADPYAGNSERILLDGEGYPHISYFQSGVGIKHVYKCAQGWHSEVIGQPGPGSTWSLAVDAADRPHMSLCMNARLLYVHRDATGWQFEDVDTQGEFNSLQLDPAGYPHIAYWAEETDNLKYAYKDASGWHIQTVDPGPGVGTWATLVLDQGWYPSILYRRPALTDLKRAWIPTTSTISLTATLVGGAVTLTWSPVEDVTNYWVYGASNLPWFVPGGAPGYDLRLDVLPSGSATWSNSSGVGDPEANWTYLVIAVDATESELARSNRAGEQDYAGDIP
jgi:hypothetical protein